MSFDEQLKAAVRASAAPVPEDFLWNTEQMIDRLPGNERPVMKRKLSFALVLALLLCLLAVGAVAAVLLSSQELVEREGQLFGEDSLWANASTRPAGSVQTAATTSGDMSRPTQTQQSRPWQKMLWAILLPRWNFTPNNDIQTT